MADPITLAAIGAPIIEGALGFFGGQQTNAANAQQAKDQMAFQERMRSTQYQTAVADMKKAGLNPALAYQQGGAGTPSGAMATMQNAASGLRGTAQGVAQTMATVKQAEQAEAQTRNIDANTHQLNIESADRLQALVTANDLRAHQAKQIRTDTSFASETFQDRQRQIREAINKIIADQAVSIASARDITAARRLKETQLPGAKNRQRADETLWGKMMPFIHDAKSAASATSGMAELMK